MKVLELVAVALALAAASPAIAADTHLTPDGYVVLKAGEQALVHLDDAHHIVVDQVGPIQPDSGKPNAAAADHLLLTFSTSGPMPGSSLTVKNGYTTGFNYLARMRKGARVAPTNVCGLIPHGEGFENWPYSLDAVEVGGFAAADITALHC